MGTVTTEIDVLEGEALAYAVALADNLKLMPFNDLFMKNATRLEFDREHANHLLSFQPLRGKYCIPHQEDGAEVIIGLPIPEVSRESGMVIIEQGLVSVEPLHSASDENSGTGKKFKSRAINGTDESIGNSAILAIHRCYAKSRLGFTVDLPDCYVDRSNDLSSPVLKM